MRIALDAKWYHRGPPGGRSYLRGLLHALARRPGPHEWRFLLGPGDPGPDPRAASPGGMGAPGDPSDVGGWSARDHPRVRWEAGGPRLALLRLRWLARQAGRWADVIVTHSLIPPNGGRDRGDRRPKTGAGPHRPPRRVVIVYDVLPASHPHLFTRVERWYFRGVARALRDADRVVTISAHARDEIARRFGVAPERLALVGPGLDAQWRTPPPADAVAAVRARHGLPERFLLSVGRPNRRKNLPLVLRACARAAGALPLVIAGPWGPRDLRRLHREAGIASDAAPLVRALGWVDDAELPALTAAATALIYVPTAEGFGLPALEAMAAGTPVIASDTTSLPAVVGDAALLVPPENAEALAAAITRLQADPALAARLRAAGPARAAAFSWERSAAIFVETLAEFGGS